MANRGGFRFTSVLVRGVLFCCIVCAALAGVTAALEFSRAVTTPTVVLVAKTPATAASTIVCPAGYDCLMSTEADSRWGAGNYKGYSNTPCALTGGAGSELQVPKFCYMPLVTSVTTRPPVESLARMPGSQLTLETVQVPAGQFPVVTVVQRVAAVEGQPQQEATQGPGAGISSLASKEPAGAREIRQRSAFDSIYDFFAGLIFCQMKSSCDGKCTDTKTDPANCGSCGNQCSAGEPCTDGSCGIICPLGLSECREGSCVDTNADSENCGTCGNICMPGDHCCSGVCVNLRTDNNNCGRCGISCGAGSTCRPTNEPSPSPVASCLYNCNGGYYAKDDRLNCGMGWNGQCGKVCSDGYVCSDYVWANGQVKSTGKYDCVQCAAWGSTPMTQCGNDCKDLLQDNDNCGSCGNRCSGQETCCKGKCIDLTNDFYNCGSCGHGCWPGQVCSNGWCEATCASGFTNCNGKCVDLNSDRLNCGACGRGVWPTYICDKGKIVECPGNTESCKNTCTDLSSDRMNCGSCGFECANGCYQGKCI